ncbi:MAG: T9SS type A sorting domain-containing protein [Raineya sp.]|nr:T9SS type A sorting domain-containing protein [Raineya sp.]
MKVRLLLPLLLIVIAFKVYGQVGQNPPTNPCSDNIRTTAPTVNVWDWRTPTWEAYLASYFNPPINEVISPFYVIASNTYEIAQFAVKDFEPDEGWEFVKRNIGSPSFRTSRPYWVFYNKNTAILRVFFLIPKSSAAQTNDPNKGGYISIEFYRLAAPVYQSNLLTAKASPLLPTDVFKDSTNIKAVNRVINADLEWMYADFPMFYDPCTCLYSGSLLITAHFFNTAQVNMTLNSLPYSSPANNNTATGDIKSLFSTVSNKVEGGVKVLTQVADAVQDLNKRWEAAGLQSPSVDISQFEKFLKGAKAAALIIPKVGAVVSAVLTAIDFFVGKSKKNNSESTITGVVILNNFKANGSITSLQLSSEAIFRIPGSNHNGASPDALPVYDNPLGIFNLLTTPEVIQYNHNYEFLAYSNNPCTSNPIYQTIQIKQRVYEITKPLEYVINPALNINYNLSDIQAALIFEGSDEIPTLPAGIRWSNATLDSLTKREGDKDYRIYRSHYYPLNCFIQAKPFFRFARFVPTYRDAPVCGSDNPKEPEVYVKIVARLVKNNSTDPKDDIVFIGKYPVKLTKLNTPNGQIPSSPEDIPEIVIIPDGQVYSQTTTIRALNLVSVGNVVLRNGARLIVRAGQIQIRSSNTGITPQYDLQTVNLYPSICNIKQPPASPARIYQFCRNSLYAYPARFTTISKELQDVATDAENGTFLLSAYPNPTKADVTISYFLEKDEKVLVYLSNIMGERLLTLVDTEQKEGKQEVTFSTQNLSPGVYLYTLQTSEHTLTRRLVVIK